MTRAESPPRSRGRDNLYFVYRYIRLRRGSRLNRPAYLRIYFCAAPIPQA